MSEDKVIDPLPEHFASIEEASDFWDTHDSADYEEHFRPVDVELEVTEEAPNVILVERSLAEKLRAVARERGISVETLVNLWLSEKLAVKR